MSSCPFLQSQSYYDNRFYRILGLATVEGAEVKADTPKSVINHNF